VYQIAANVVSHRGLPPKVDQTIINSKVAQSILKHKTRFCNVQWLQKHVGNAAQKQFAGNWLLLELFPFRSECFLRSVTEISVQLVEEEDVQRPDSVAFVEG
jgi:hypothetical protein